MHTDNIWCCRKQQVYFLISRVYDHYEPAWYIVLFGREFWFGPGRPAFLNKRKKS